jgi:sugar-specific transcriptional regulator TrmB
MKSLDKGVQILNNLGLTSLQAKVYLSLLRNGKATIKAISKFSNIDRSNVYKTINVLSNKHGLIQQTIGFPNIYEAIPLQSAIKVLMEHKRETEREIEEEIGYYLEENRLTQLASSEETEATFIMIPQKEAFIKKLRSELDSVQDSVEIFITAKCFPEIVEHLSRCKRLLDLKVTFRVLVEKYEPQKPIPKEARKLFVNLNSEIRNTFACPVVSVLVFDSKRTLLIIDPTLDFGYSQALWTNHTGLAAIIQDYFEKLWVQAQKLEPISFTKTNKPSKKH